MSPKVLIPGLLSVALAAVFIAYARPTAKSSDTQDLPQSDATTASADGPKSNSLALQPEAVKLSRRIRAKGFDPQKPRTVVVDGVLTTATDRRNVQIVRTQTLSGEQVDITLTGTTVPLSWDATSGARTSSGTISTADRALLERFTFDGADQFILAQLRGASYSVIARNVRPDDAPENYSGPLWDIVRIDDPEQDAQKQLLSRWRLYYLNTTTGLIDKISYDSQGDRVEAKLSEWTERNGEKFPASITWTSHEKPLATFNVTNVSFVAQ
jgi:hypothetical protein